MLKENKVRHGKYSADNVRNVFRGVCHCAKCGVSMRVLNGGYLQCGGVQVGKCDIRNVVPFVEMERELISWFVPQAKDALLGKDETFTAIDTLQGKLNAIQKRIEATLTLLDAGVAVNEVQTRLVKLDHERREIENDLANAKAEQSSKASIPDTLNQLNTLIDEGNMGNQATRKKIASLVPSIVKDVVVDLTDKCFPSFVCHLVNGQSIEWEYDLQEFGQKIRGITKDGNFVLGKPYPIEGNYRVKE